MIKTIVAITALTVMLFPVSIAAHPGGTDAQGGHYCRTSCELYGLKVNEYHFHTENDTPVFTWQNNERLYDRALAERLHGRILLQVQDNGEAWYIRDTDSLRYYMKNGEAAYEMMRYFSLGITNENLVKIPAVDSTQEMNDSISACAENQLANKLRGKILLQVENNGEAWYVEPQKCRMIYMADGAAAYTIMRYLGLGITNPDLEKIPVGSL